MKVKKKVDKWIWQLVNHNKTCLHAIITKDHLIKLKSNKDSEAKAISKDKQLLGLFWQHSK